MIYEKVIENVGGSKLVFLVLKAIVIVQSLAVLFIKVSIQFFQKLTAFFVKTRIVDDFFRVPLLLVGNKVDLQHSSRVVPQAEAKNFAEKWHARFIEVSAKDNLVGLF